MIAFRYIIFHLILLFVLLSYSKKISKTNKEFWKLSLFPIILFSIEEGLRWGRDGDWWGYRNTFNMLANGYDVNNEFLFKQFWRLLSFVGLDYTFAIYFASLLFIFSVFYLLGGERKYFYISLPLFVIWLSPLAIQLIRWFMGLSFCFIALRLMMEKKNKLAALCIIVSLLIHTFSCVLFIPCVIVYQFWKKEILSPTKVILFSMILVIFANLSFMENFFSLLSVFSNSSRYSGYVENADVWFATSGGDGYNRKSTFSYLAVMMPFYVALYSYSTIKKLDKNYHFFYNVLILNILLRSISSGSEIVQRIATIYDFSFLIVSSVVLFYHQKLRFKFLLLILLATFVYKAYIFIKPYKSDLLMMYVWDSNKLEDYGKAYLLFNQE